MMSTTHNADGEVWGANVLKTHIENKDVIVK